MMYCDYSMGSIKIQACQLATYKVFKEVNLLKGDFSKCRITLLLRSLKTKCAMKY